MESEVGNLIDFANDILKKKKINVGETRVHCSLIKYKQKGTYKILEDIIENVTLLQLMDLLGNVNRDISVVGNWIFESKYEKSLVLNMASLEMICDPSVDEEQATKFESVLTAVRYIRSAVMYPSKHNYIQTFYYIKIEGNYIDLLTNSYSKVTNLF